MEPRVAERISEDELMYVDVFISHKKDDAEKAARLKQRIENLGLTCWIDANDKELARLHEARPVDYRALTNHIRKQLRKCRSLIFAYSSSSHESRWMPWELGFYDGRWGQRLIGLYDLEKDPDLRGDADLNGEAEDKRAPKEQPSDQGAIGIFEFQRIYEELTPETLEGFLQYVHSPRALADRADVDADRWANLVAGIMRDPVSISIDACQFWICYHQAFWSRAFGTFAPDGSQPLLGLTEAVRTALAPLAAMMRVASPGVPDRMDGIGAEQTGVAQYQSRRARQWPGILPPAALGAVDGALQFHKDLSVAAQGLSVLPRQ